MIRQQDLNSHKDGGYTGLYLKFENFDKTEPIQIFISDQSKKYYSKNHNVPMYVSLGADTQIYLKKTIIKRLGYPYSDCMDEIVANNVSYTYDMSTCHEFCYLYKEAEQCGYLDKFATYSHLLYANETQFYEENKKEEELAKCGTLAVIKDLFSEEGIIK